MIEPWHEVLRVFACVASAVSDFQGFEACLTAPQQKVNLPSLPFDNIITIISSRAFILSSSVFDHVHIHLLSCFIVSANWTPPLLSGPGSFTPLPVITPQLFQQTPPDFQPQPISTQRLCSSALVQHSLPGTGDIFLAGPSCSSQRYIHLNPSFVERDF